MQVNHKIVIATVVIMAGGAYHVLVSKNGTLTRVLVGGYLLALTASVLDLIGGPVSQLIGWLMLLAAGGVIVTTILPALNRPAPAVTNTATGGTSPTHQ